MLRQSTEWPDFRNAVGKPLALLSVVNRVILPVLNRCEHCAKGEAAHSALDHPYKRDERIPEWHGWHAARCGLGSNPHRLGVPDMVIQRILRHANVNIPALKSLTDAFGTLKERATPLSDAIQ